MTVTLLLCAIQSPVLVLKSTPTYESFLGFGEYDPGPPAAVHASQGTIVSLCHHLYETDVCGANQDHEGDTTPDGINHCSRN